jgi:hypothetical protein
VALSEHVDVIQRGPELWNEWREGRTEERPDLLGARLRGLDLREARLSDADLVGADLRAAHLARADLRGADLSDADLRAAKLRGADLTGAVLDGALLRGADLRDSALVDAGLSHADVRGSDLRGADLTRAGVTDAVFTDAKLRGAVGVNPFRIQPLYSRRLETGAQVAYKLVTPTGEGTFAGGIDYVEALSTGEVVRLPEANTDEFEACAAGINVATLVWALNEWRDGYRILEVGFGADDIAAIPWTSDGKFRLFRCRVLREISLGDIHAAAS